MARLSAPSAHDVRDWSYFSAVITSRVYRAMLLTLVAIAIAPVALSWQPFVIKSGSMEPSVATGDVALGRPYERGEKIAVGRVYMFNDRSAQDERVLVHRIVERRDDGAYTTAGDANAIPDLTPITPADVEARAILLVPYVGLPIVWMQTGQWALLGLWLMLTMAAFFLAARKLEGEPPSGTLRRLVRTRLGRAPGTRATEDPASPAPGEDRPKEHLVARGARAVAATLIICVAGTATLGSANATFTDTTRNEPNTFTAGSWMLPYVAAVSADSPRGFWLLDETSGTAVRDHSRTYADGSTSGGTTRGVPGAHTPRNPGTSFRFDGGQAVLHPSTMTVSNTHSVELWFRTTSTQEGYLIGFEDPNVIPAWNYDRTVLMDDGRIVVGNWTLVGRNTVTTPNRYNDGKWHHLVVTMAPGPIFRGPTSTIFIDGAQVAQGETSSVSTSFRGQWQVGRGSRAGGSIFRPFPVEVAFRGDIDAVSIFDRALSPARVRAHWDAR